MLYTLLWFLTRWMAVVHHRRVLVQGAASVPLDQPVLLAVNHTNAFWDAMLTATALPRRHRVRFLTRGDVFKKPLASAILRNIGLLPVYRFRDGFSSLKGNSATFRASIDALLHNGTVLIFPEGQCQPIPQLQPLMKGAARLAAQAMDAGVEDLVVVPVSLSFAQHGRFRADVGIRFGTPVPAKTLFGLPADAMDHAAAAPADGADSVAAAPGSATDHDAPAPADGADSTVREPEPDSRPAQLKRFTARLHARMLAQTVHLADLELGKALAEAVPPATAPDGLQAYDGTWMESRRRWAERFNQAPDAARPFAERRAQRRQSGRLPGWIGYPEARLRMPLLPSTRLPAAWPPELPSPERHSARHRALSRLWPLLLLSPVLLLPHLIHRLALGAAERIIVRKVRDPQFIDSLRAVLGMAFFGVQALLITLLVCVFFARTGEPLWAGLSCLLPIGLYHGSLWALRLEERWVEWRHLSRKR